MARPTTVRAEAGVDRLASIDLLRGLLMVVMALDHAGFMVGRFHSQEMWAGAWTRYSSAIPFLTRFVTHFCAPGFFLLMGAGLLFRSVAECSWGSPPSSKCRRFSRPRSAARPARGRTRTSPSPG